MKLNTQPGGYAKYKQAAKCKDLFSLAKNTKKPRPTRSGLFGKGRATGDYA